MASNDFPAKEEAQSRPWDGPSHFVPNAVEALEDSGEFLGRDSVTPVGYDDKRILRVAVEGDDGLPGLGSVFEGVGEQVLQHHGEGFGVDPSADSPGQIHPEPQEPLPKPMVHLQAYPLNQGGQFQRFQAKFQLAGIGPGRLEEVGHQVRQPMEISVHEGLDAGFLLRGQLPAEHGLHPHAQAGDGGLELMGD